MATNTRVRYALATLGALVSLLGVLTAYDVRVHGSFDPMMVSFALVMIGLGFVLVSLYKGVLRGAGR